MAYKYSAKSKAILSTVDARLQKLFNEVIKYYDVSIIEGKRDIETQKRYLQEGKSKTLKSKHLNGLAVDVGVYPLDFNNINSFCELARCVKTIATQQGLEIIWGGDWKTFKDYVHFEIK